MVREHIPHPGTYFKGVPTKSQLTIESIVRKELRKCGYPCVNCNDCDSSVQPNLCETLAAAGCAGAFLVNNGIEIVEGLAGLGGPLVRTTEIDTATFDFEISKGNVRMEVDGTGGSLGSGETARFYGDSGLKNAEMGVYTNGSGAPSLGLRTYSTASDIYSRLEMGATLDRISARIGLASDVDFWAMELSQTLGVTLGFSTNVRLEIIKQNFTGGTFIALMRNLPTFADNTAAVAALLPTEAIYKTSAGELRIVV